MDYLSKFIDMEIYGNTLDDIGIARLFYDVHSGCIRYILESKCWYYFGDKRWVKD